MDGLTIFAGLGVIVLLWLCLLGYSKLAKAQRDWLGLFTELEKSSRKLKENSTRYADAVAMRGRKAISGHFN